MRAVNLLPKDDAQRGRRQQNLPALISTGLIVPVTGLVGVLYFSAKSASTARTSSCRMRRRSWRCSRPRPSSQVRQLGSGSSHPSARRGSQRCPQRSPTAWLGPRPARDLARSARRRVAHPAGRVLRRSRRPAPLLDDGAGRGSTGLHDGRLHVLARRRRTADHPTLRRASRTSGSSAAFARSWSAAT